MTFTDAVKQILTEKVTPITPQEIKELIKIKYPEYFGTESQKINVEKGYFQNIDHALTAQIYSLVRTNDSFYCDKTSRPMKISLIEEQEEIELINEDFESEEGIVYVLKTNTFTKEGKEIIKIGITIKEIEKRLAQLYTTGVPFEFKVHKLYNTKNYYELEQALHKLLSVYKINKSREFFTSDAIPFIEKIVEIHKEIQKLA
jgi:hypothetical protein